MMHLFHKVSQDCSRITTNTYSTSFASAIRLLHKDFRAPICNIYGFVRFADEIVDSFHGHDQACLLRRFREETFLSIQEGLNLNPILHSFQLTVRQYSIDPALVGAFFRSMEMDLVRQEYDRELYETYIYGSAEVVGLMCLYVFCEGRREEYERLAPFARALGSAFQKVNFLRDIRADSHGLQRRYFPGMDAADLTAGMKAGIEADIAEDFRIAAEGIALLPIKARFGVYVAYKYYLSLFKKIRQVQPAHILENRVRLPNYRKLMIVVRAGVKNQLNLI